MVNANVKYQRELISSQLLTLLYAATPDGYYGDEDNGQTSAWYVFSSLGFYPVAPATNQFVLRSPLFDSAILKLRNGNTFKITAENNDADTPYIQNAQLNGKGVNRTWIGTSDLQKGGKLVFDMGSEPNINWAVSDDAVHYSLSRKD